MISFISAQSSRTTNTCSNLITPVWHLHGDFILYCHFQISCKNVSVAVVQSLSCVQLFGAPWTAIHQASLSVTISQNWLKLMFIVAPTPTPHHLLHSTLRSIRVFAISWLFLSCSQSIGASASASVLLMSIQGWSPLGLTGLIGLLSKGL